jgi:hypothetical protein
MMSRHRDMMRFVLGTLGIDEGNTFEGDYRARLERLMAVNGLHSVIYSNVCPTSPDGRTPTLPRRLYFSVREGNIAVTELAQGDVAQLTGIGYLNRASHYLVVQDSEGDWSVHDRKIDAEFAHPCGEWKKVGEAGLPNPIFRQVYHELVEAGYSEQPPKEGRDKLFSQVANAVQRQVNKAFYAEVRLRVDIHQLDADGKETNHFIAINDEDVSAYDIRLDITLDADGRPTIRHHAKDSYLQGFVSKWQREAEARGYDPKEVDIEAIRKEVLADFTSAATEQSFFNHFIQEARGLFTSAVAGYVEGVQATQKVTQHVWAEGTVNESTWHSAGELASEHQEWPPYMRLAPVVGGATNGIVDEIVGIPMAIRGLYDLATDDDQREALLGLFSKEGLNLLVESIGEEIDNIREDVQVREHFAAKTTVSVGSMMMGTGLFVKAGKIKELLDLITEKLRKYADPKTLDRLEELKKGNRNKFDEVEIQKFVDGLDEDLLHEILEEATLLGLTKGKPLSFGEIQALWKRGNDFNLSARADASYVHEVWLYHPKKVYPNGHKNAGSPQRFRLDSWDGVEGKIVSRKATNLDEITKETFERYVKEISEKYPVGSKLANPRHGDKLTGSYYLEIPESNSSFGKLTEYRELASKYNIEIIFRPE